jgi:hypothetical protein
MPNWKRLSSIITVALLLAVFVYAAAQADPSIDTAYKTPPLTKDFIKFCEESTVDCGHTISPDDLTYCTDHFDACRTEVVNVDNLNSLNQVGGDHHSCTFPKTGGRTMYHSDTIAATKAILGWLKANSAVRAPKTDDAIEQAMAALWPDRCMH